MKVHELRAMPSDELSDALAEFEARFVYPLGPGRSFRVSHGRDYPRFFRAMGNATCFICEKHGRVTGALGVAVRPVISPNGGELQAAYIGDLKVDPSEGSPRTFLRLALAADAWARPQVTAAFGVVMDGTRVLPASYTGRAGIEAFFQVARASVLRLATGTESSGTCASVAADAGESCFRKLSRGRYAVAGGNPAERSALQPRWLVHPDGLACGRLEDTRLAKRLIGSDGVEMESAHLSCFAWRTPGAAADLIQTARCLASREGLPGLFVALADIDLPSLQPALRSVEMTVAPATIYAAGAASGHAWNINSSEI